MTRLCEAEGVGVNLWGALAGGMLSGKLSQLAIAWLLGKEIVSSVVCGVSSVEQLDENLGALEFELSADDLEACDEVWRMLMPKPTIFYARGYGIDFG